VRGKRSPLWGIPIEPVRIVTAAKTVGERQDGWDRQLEVESQFKLPAARLFFTAEQKNNCNGKTEEYHEFNGQVLGGTGGRNRQGIVDKN
jgi:hypothetical protein